MLFFSQWTTTSTFSCTFHGWNNVTCHFTNGFCYDSCTCINLRVFFGESESFDVYANTSQNKTAILNKDMISFSSFVTSCTFLHLQYQQQVYIVEFKHSWGKLFVLNTHNNNSFQDMCILIC